MEQWSTEKGEYSLGICIFHTKQYMDVCMHVSGHPTV